MGLTVDTVWRALRSVNDPELPLSIVDLGMVYDVKIGNTIVNIDLTFTSIGCPAIDMIISDIKKVVLAIPAVKQVNVDVVWSPPWTKEKITSSGREILAYHGVGI